MTRRTALTALLAGAARAAGRPFRYAICSETFAGSTFEQACPLARRCGYTGIELAPFQLGEDPAATPPARRKELRRAAADAGLVLVGSHALLNAPKDLHLTTDDTAVRERSWEYLRRVVDLTADLGDRPVLVLGSGKQRAAASPDRVAAAVGRVREGLAKLAPHAEARRATVLLEPLAPQFTNVVNSLDEAMAVVKAIGSPAIQTIFDTHNTVREERPHTRALERHFAHIRHIHLNEMDGRYPGSGDYPFLPLLQKLHELHYAGWLSVEVFDFQPDGETVARRAREFLRGLEAQVK